jgi:predicted transcriptional regulator
MSKKIFNFYLDQDLKKRIEAEAARKSTPMAYVIEDCIILELNRRDRVLKQYEETLREAKKVEDIIDLDL